MPERSQPRTDPVMRAHLTGRSHPSPPVARYPPSEDLGDIARGFWIPAWDYPPGEVRVQRVLQYPVCLVVVAVDYARFIGVTTGLSTVELAGRGWAVGLMLQPAGGRWLLGRSVAPMVDTHLDLAEVEGIDGGRLARDVRRVMDDDPASVNAHRQAMRLVEDAIRPRGPVDAIGGLVNDIVAHVENHPDLMRVDELAAAAAVSERHLQRLTREWIGVSPKWLIQRRRLHDAAEQLKSQWVDLAELAASLGYSDQAHFTRDWSRVTGVPPGAYRGDQPHDPGPRRT